MGWEYSENGTANEKTKGVFQIWERGYGSVTQSGNGVVPVIWTRTLTYTHIYLISLLTTLALTPSLILFLLGSIHIVNVSLFDDYHISSRVLSVCAVCAVWSFGIRFGFLFLGGAAEREPMRVDH